ncbi:aflatoxin-detoxifizyme [Cutaneotrichosporon oleaginosum]|uniref:Dipeptidyl peptidase 3 n=1 Tax=Cutaneotrichosporon oleaginosum TaxID=879819 RepID=A0A0J0XUB6_9TREE|nr:aflatoxin-detoxifizyme [Cutaneotrichosporon oleaginosum]KLT44691.1 aflatoxin-detoxifizyme [Cutaneotrichosporon oleaginosum]TXT07677.1 hypothetical protein COLE_04601 [Cutaneotrichosporon oleaginosum]
MSANALGASLYYADAKAPICPLVIKEHFDKLNTKEQLYAHHIARASWIGGRVILKQTTPTASDLFDLLRATFSASDPTKLGDLEAQRKQAGLTTDDFTSVLEYTAQVLGNLANFKSFGDSKFIPRVDAATFRKVVAAAPRAHEALPLWDKLQEEIYGIKPAARTLLGYPDAGHVTGYYSGDVTEADIKAVQKWYEGRGKDALNTRLFKRGDVYELRVASADTAPTETFDVPGLPGKLEVVFGDFAEEMKGVADELEAAIPYAANEHQRKMLEAYVRHFHTGDVDAHKESQREWIQDIGPTVETNIGFVESYRDPAGVRAEFEGFVAMVNKEMTKKFERLVDAAETYIPKLPWGKDFEKDKFRKPDFTSLEVLTFSTGGVPAGINIPNYDDIRMTFGFKNVSLGNVLNAKAPDEKITFLGDADAALFQRLRGPAFEVQVGIHELLGHGSGKLLQENADGTANFDLKNPPINPLTGKPVEHWYGPGETWGSRFKTIAASYEECRAEAVAMSLSTDKSLLEIFGHTDSSAESADDIMYVGWLQMARAGLIALEFYDPEAKKWGQAHMQARHALLRVFLEAGFVRIEETDRGKDLVVVMERGAITGTGQQAVDTFLTALQIYKATGDVEGGKALYDKYTSVGDEWLPRRDVVLAKRQPRKLLLQANTFRDGDGVRLKEYEATLPGFIESYLERAI